MHKALPTINDLRDPALTQALRAALDNKTKPLGSLGRLEALALQLGEILGSQSPVLDQPQMVVFAGDHGITAQGVSAFPSEVSWQMVENFLAGGAAVSVLARQHGLALTVVDCGVKHDFLAGLPAGSQRPGLQVRRAVGAHLGTADSSQQPAMSVNCGFTSTGMPIGLQIVAPAYREDLALAAAAAFESVRGAVKWPGM
jgi:nicotinate-nucleotide--dimethylbenzimidazole phosphoribosyltransferase